MKLLDILGVRRAEFHELVSFPNINIKILSNHIPFGHLFFLITRYNNNNKINKLDSIILLGFILALIADKAIIVYCRIHTDFFQAIADATEKILAKLKSLGSQNTKESILKLEKQLEKSFKLYRVPKMRPIILETLRQLPKVPDRSVQFF